MNCHKLGNLILGVLAFAAIGQHERRPWWPSAATCAFLTSGLTILQLVLLQWQLNHTYIWVMVGVLDVFGIAAKATALWDVGRRQRGAMPVSARSGQWAVATYVAVLTAEFVLIVMMIVFGLIGLANVGDIDVWQGFIMKLYHVGGIPLTLAFGCLGWASRGGTGSQRWASGDLLALAALGVFSVTWRLFGLPTGRHWLWLGAALGVPTWAALGAWLRRVFNEG